MNERSHRTVTIHRARWWTGYLFGVLFFIFWLSDFSFGNRDPSQPNQLHRYPLPYKPWVYLTLREAVVGYAILISLAVVFVVLIVLTEIASRQRRHAS